MQNSRSDWHRSIGVAKFIGALVFATSSANFARSEPGVFDLLGLELKVCADPTLVSEAACRAHRHAVASVGGTIVAIYVERRKAGANIPELHIDNSRYIEEVGRLRSLLVQKGIAIEPVRVLYSRSVAFSVMDQIQARVSSLLYSYRNKLGDDVVQIPLSSEAALAQGVGLCGDQVEAFRAVLAKLNIATRPVQFWWRNAKSEPQNHIAAEVEIDGRWEFFDITWGATFAASDGSERLLSAGEVRLMERPTPTLNNNNPQYRFTLRLGEDPFAYLGPGVDMTINNAGAISLRTKQESEERLVADLRHIPNFIGDNEQDGNTTLGTYYLTVDLVGRYNVTVHIKAIAGCASSKIAVGDQENVPKAGEVVFVDIEAPMQIRLTGQDDICYAVISDIHFRPSTR